MTPIAMLDFDGTLAKGYISMEFLDTLEQYGALVRGSHARQMALLENHHQGRLKYAQWCEAWGLEWAAGLAGQSTNHITKIAQRFFAQYQNHIYPASFALIDVLKERGYSPIMLSLGAYEVTALASRALGIKECYATRLETIDGIYSGRLTTRLHLPGGKGALAQQIITNEGATSQECAAFGDSESDVEFMEICGYPVATCPSPAMARYSTARSWPILPLNRIAPSEVADRVNGILK